MINRKKIQSHKPIIKEPPKTVTQTYGKKGAWPGLRCPVNIALTEDGGKTFPLIRQIERGEGYVGDENRFNNRQYEYPCIMQSADGMIHIAYAYQTRRGVKWVSLSEDAVIGGKRGESTYNPTSGDVGAHPVVTK